MKLPSSFQIQAYINYLVQSGNRHSVHSPFIFQLLENTIAPKKKSTPTQNIELLRAQLLKDERWVEIKDYGAGSRSGMNLKRQIKQIAKHVSQDKKRGQLLYRLVRDLKPKTILELGTSIGIGTSYLASAAPKAKVISIEGCPHTAKIAFENFHKLHLNHIKQRLGDFMNVLPKVMGELDQLDFVFIDGNHTYNATMDLFQLCSTKCHNDSLIIIDDIYWSEDMQKAWNSIKNLPKTQVTIDLFDFGLVFFRKEQVKQHFILRYK